MFGFFRRKKKKEEPNYDPTNLRITDLRKGWFVDYDFQTWEAIEEYEYDWGSQDFSYEFLLDNGSGQQLFLSIEEDDGLNCVIFEKMRFSTLPQADEIEAAVKSNGKPPRQLQVNGIRYYFDGEYPGFWRNIKASKSQEFMLWDYWDDSDEKCLNIEQWDDNTFEAALGTWKPEHAFSNLTPREQA